jgi:hypothetical protein
MSNLSEGWSGEEILWDDKLVSEQSSGRVEDSSSSSVGSSVGSGLQTSEKAKDDTTTATARDQDIRLNGDAR